MRHDEELHDAALRELAQRLGAEAAERLDVERTAQAVVTRLKAEPRATRWTWREPAWLRIAAVAVLVVGAGGGLVLRYRTGHFIAPETRSVVLAEPAGADLNDLSAAQLREVLRTVEQGGPDHEAVSAQDVGLEDLSTPQLRALLESLEG